MKKNYLWFYGITTLLMLICWKSVAQQDAPNAQLVNVITGIDVPWGMVQLPDGSFLISERSGKLYLVNIRTSGKKNISGLPPIDDRGQGGLLDIALHPDYLNTGWIYFSYSSPEGEGIGSNTAIMRAKLKDFTLVEQSVLYKATPNTTAGQHFGSRIEFDKKGYLFFSIGDRGERDINPQDITRDGGKIYRLYDDGSIPKDNPFVGIKNAKSAIYSFGHRNPQGLTMHPVTGEIWSHEHGPRGGDEVNLVQKGRNYGWPVISYGINYNGSKLTDITEKPGMEQPIWYWDPSIAPSGMTFVSSDLYPQWKGHLLVGSLKFNYLVLCHLEGNKIISQQILFEGIGRVRNVKQMPDGYIYVATENNKIVKIKPI